MNLYETTFIINPQTDDATIDRHVRDIAGLISANDGKIRYEDHMGTRRLAYEIKGLTQGYYASFIFEAPTSVLPKLTRYFKLNEQYIRHLTVRFEGDLSKLVEPTDVAVEKAEEKPAEKTEPAVEETPSAEPADEAVETEKTSEGDGLDDTAEISLEGQVDEEPTESKSEDDEQEL